MPNSVPTLPIYLPVKRGLGLLSPQYVIAPLARAADSETANKVVNAIFQRLSERPPRAEEDPLMTEEHARCGKIWENQRETARRNMEDDKSIFMGPTVQCSGCSAQQHHPLPIFDLVNPAQQRCHLCVGTFEPRTEEGQRQNDIGIVGANEPDRPCRVRPEGLLSLSAQSPVHHGH